MIILRHVDAPYCREFLLSDDDLKEQVALAIPYTFDENFECLALEDGELQLAIGGLSDKEVIWLLTGPTVQNLKLMQKVEFVHKVKELLDYFQKTNTDVPYFYNVVWSKLPNHHKFIESLGARIDYSKTYKSEINEEFYYFVIDNPYYKEV